MAEDLHRALPLLSSASLSMDHKPTVKKETDPLLLRLRRSIKNKEEMESHHDYKSIEPYSQQQQQDEEAPQYEQETSYDEYPSHHPQEVSMEGSQQPPLLEIPEEVYAVRKAALKVLKPLTRTWVSDCKCRLVAASLTRIIGCHFRRVRSYGTLWHVPLDTIVARIALLVHFVALLVVAHWIVVVAHFVRQGTVHLYCARQRKSTKTQFARSCKSDRISTAPATVVEIWTQDWVVEFLHLLFGNFDLRASRCTPTDILGMVFVSAVVVDYRGHCRGDCMSIATCDTGLVLVLGVDGHASHGPESGLGIRCAVASSVWACHFGPGDCVCFLGVHCVWTSDWFLQVDRIAADGREPLLVVGFDLHRVGGRHWGSDPAHKAG